VRIFLAVIPPQATQTLAATVIEKLRKPNDHVSWVAPRNLHYTMRFIGEVGDDGARRIEEAAREAAASQSRFGVALGPPGAFPTARRARVLWLGVNSGNEAFARLAGALEASLERRGFAPEARDFTAHLTLGRAREPVRDWTADLSSTSAPEGADARFGVEAIDVVESRLSREGSVYTVRARAPLQS